MPQSLPSAVFVAQALISAAIVLDEVEYLKSFAEKNNNLHFAVGLRARFIAAALLKRRGYGPPEEISLLVGLGLRNPIPRVKHAWYTRHNIDKADDIFGDRLERS